MFSRRDGPTALVPNLVRAIAFSADDGVLETAEGNVRARAGIVAVWDGKLGQVLVLVRLLDHGHVDRFAFQRRISSEAALTNAIREAQAVAEQMGLPVDDPSFVDLDREERDRRLRYWNLLRRPSAPAAGASGSPAVDLPFEGSGDRSVLGRVRLVQRRVGSDGGNGSV